MAGLAVAAALAAAPPAPAHDAGPAGHHDGHSAGAAAGAGRDGAERAEVELLDLPLVDAEGRRRDFARDVIGDRIVALNFIYTSCTTVCPITSAIFQAVQDQLGDDLGRDVRLVSLSIDPVTDIPPRLKRYAQKFDAEEPGWTFLTGDESDMDRVLAGLGAYTTDFEDHPPMILVGDARRGVWRRLYGFPAPERIVDELTRLRAARGEEE